MLTMESWESKKIPLWHYDNEAINFPFIEMDDDLYENVNQSPYEECDLKAI